MIHNNVNNACLYTLTGEGNGNALQYSAWKIPWVEEPGVTKSQTRLIDFTFTFHFHASEKEMATHSSVLAWRIPGTGEPGGLPSMGSHRVGHDWSDLAAAAAYDYYPKKKSNYWGKNGKWLWEQLMITYQTGLRLALKFCRRLKVGTTELQRQHWKKT